MAAVHQTLDDASEHCSNPSEALSGAGQLPRVASSASCVPETCHVEDVSVGCQMHSHLSDMTLSRHITTNGIPEGGQRYHNGQDGDHISDNDLEDAEAPLEIGTKSVTHASALAGAAATPGTIRNPTPLIVQPPSPNLSPLRAFDHGEGDINQEFRNMGEPFGYEAYIPSEDAFISAAEYPAAPPINEDLLLPGSPSDTNTSQEQGRNSPFDDGDEPGDDLDQYNVLFSGSNEPIHPDSMFDTPQFERHGFEGIQNQRESGFFENHDMHQHDGYLEKNPATSVNDGKEQHGEKEDPLPSQVMDTHQENQERGEGNSSPLFFNDVEEVEGGDFFSSISRRDDDQVPAATLENLFSNNITADLIPTQRGKYLPDGKDGTISFVKSIHQNSHTGVNTDVTSTPTGHTAGDLEAKWNAVLGDDEDLLPDDGEGFLSSDEEGDNLTATAVGHTQLAKSGYTASTAATGTFPPYLPHPESQTTTTNQSLFHAFQEQLNYDSSAQQSSATTYAAPQQAPYSQAQNQSVGARASFPPFKPAAPFAPQRESFVDKKGGYQSPYDLPDDIIRKPPISKRANAPLGSNPMPSPILSPPARQSSLGATSIPPPGPPSHLVTGYIKPNAPNAASGIAGAAKPPVSAPPKQTFFEELPTPKGRPGSRYQPSLLPLGRSGSADPQSYSMFFPPAVHGVQDAQVQPTQQSAPSTPRTNLKYSPAIAAAAFSKPLGSKYSSSPVTPQLNSATFSPATSHQASPPQVSPYQQISNAPQALGNRYQPQKVGHNIQQSPQRRVSGPQTSGPDGSSNGQHQRHSPTQTRSYFTEPHQMHSSRPGTGKSANFPSFSALKEEDELSPQLSLAKSSTEPSRRYTAARTTATPPPPPWPAKGIARAEPFSPPARTESPRFSPTNMSALQFSGRTASPEGFQPPRRAQTQSPSTAMNGPMRPSSQLQFSQPPQPAPFVRPASAFAANYTADASYSLVERRDRSTSVGVTNFMPPSDPSIIDPLNRWQGCPIFTWGMGGHAAVMFPRRVQRYTADMPFPMVKCTPGEVRIRNIKDISPLETGLAKFPGPAYTGFKSASKGKKKEVLAWMTEKIGTLESGIADVFGDYERRRAEEKILLWKGVKTLLENDGALEGSSEIEKTVRSFLWPESLEAVNASEAPSISMTSSTTFPDNGTGAAMDRADPEAMKTIQKYLLSGNRTDAVWHAVDKRLWSHAMLIAGTVSQDLWKQVVQDFVRNEVKILGPRMQSMAVLYEIFGGNGEESIDELVPQSARLGQPMLTTFGSNQPANPLEGLDKWKETLALIISNRSPTDHTAIIALGKLLAAYGRVEASHLCYLFARSFINFTGPEDSNAMVSLFGCDHCVFTFDLPKDTDALLLTEVYELALSLTHTSTHGPIIPHIQAYKLYHALILAENGYRAEAQKYCEAIGTVLKSSTKPSPYFHRPFLEALEELAARLSQSPKEPGTGWLSKLSQDNISGSMWGAFSKFVAGEDNDSTTSVMAKDSGLDMGPFPKMGNSPEGSRTQSSADLYSVYSGYNPQAPNYNPTTSYNPNPAPTNSFSPYTPRTSVEQTRSGTNPYPLPSGPHNSMPYSLYDSPVSSTTLKKQPGPILIGPYMPQSTEHDSKVSFESSRQPSYDEPIAAIGYEPLASGGYEPPTSGGYEPPSGNSSYEPPSNDSTHKSEDINDEEDRPKPKKKSFMDDDDDAEFLARVAALKKEEEEKRKQKEKEEAAKSSKKSGWFSGWFARKNPDGQSGGPVKANLGEENSFYYDPDLKRWVNKKAETTTASSSTPGTPPPPRGSMPTSNVQNSRPSTSTGLVPSSPRAAALQKSSSVPPQAISSIPPPQAQPEVGGPLATTTTPSEPPRMASSATPGVSGNSTPQRLDSPAPQPSISAPPPNNGAAAGPPPARPKTVASSASLSAKFINEGDALMDELLGPPTARKAGAGAAKKKGGKSRYIDVMGKS